MTTNVIMRREFLGGEIKQRSDNGFFSATDLFKFGNNYRVKNNKIIVKMTDWLNTKRTKEFIKSLEESFGVVKISGRGRGSNTWVHPYLFIDIALTLNPELKIKVYQIGRASCRERV